MTMFKKIFTIMIALFTVQISIANAAVAPLVFSDVSNSNDFFSAITYLSQKWCYKWI